MNYHTCCGGSICNARFRLAARYHECLRNGLQGIDLVLTEQVCMQQHLLWPSGSWATLNHPSTAATGPEEVLLHTDPLGQDEVDALECIAEAFEIPCRKPKPGTANSAPRNRYGSSFASWTTHGTYILRLQAVGGSMRHLFSKFVFQVPEMDS
jgi:hypothetical protein